MSEVKKCPKCRGEMERGNALIDGKDLGGFMHLKFEEKRERWYKGTNWYEIIPYWCRNCRYLELYVGEKG